MDLQNKIALVTGGSRMGAALAEALAERGCGVVLTWRSSPQMAQETVETLKDRGVVAGAYRCDVGKDRDVQSLMGRIGKIFGRLDILIHLASIYDKVGSRYEQAMGDWDRHMTANARSGYSLARAAAPLLQRSGGGRIVFVSDWTSASGRPRYPDYPGYYVSKLAVKGAAEALALKFAPKILVNAIAPGPMLPPKTLSRAEYRAVQKATPLGRWGGAGELVKAVLFLIDTDFMTGETLRVDGGRHLY